MLPTVRKIGAGLVAGFLLAGCGPEPPEPPTMPDASRVDPDVKERVERALAEIRRHPRRAGPRAELAMIYDANALPDLAVPAYEQALALEPDRAKWWYHLARSRHQLGNVDGALEAIDRAIAQESSFAPLYWRRGLWTLALDRHAEAELAFRRATEIAPRDAAGWLGIARTLMQTKRHEQAASILESLLRQDPENGYAHQLLGRTYRHLGDTERARLELARGAGSDPRWNDAWQDEILRYRAGYRAAINAAQQAIDTGQPRIAIELLTPLRESRPGDVTVTTWLGNAYLADGQTDAALELLAAAEKEHPDHFVVQLQLGDLHGRRGDLPRALAHTERAIELNPKSGAAHFQRARLLRRLRRNEEAAEALKTAVRYDTSDLSMWIMLGEIQFGLKRFEEMAATLERAAERFPHAATPLAGLTFARGELGQLAEARAAFERAARLDPDSPDVARAQSYLRRLEQSARGAGRP